VQGQTTRTYVGVFVALAVPWAAACAGDIDGEARRRGPPGEITGSGVPGVPGGAGAGAPGLPDPNVAAADAAMRAQNPELFQLASQYFPGTIPTGGPKRLFRLTRTQLDQTARALLPMAATDSVEAALPRDPLQTNYEYAANLSWNPANFAPYTAWVTALADRVRAAPAQVIDCAAEANSPACLGLQTQRFVTRAFRGVTSEQQLARFRDFFMSSVTEVGAANATADLVDVVLTSPGYVFREEVQTGASAALLPAQLLQSVTYTLADAPPEALGLDVAQAAMLVGSEAALRQTADKVLATPRAREKLLRFFLAWLEVRAADEFEISTTVFPEFTPEVASAAVDETKRFLEHQLKAMAPRLPDITQATQSFVPEALEEIYDADSKGAQVLAPLDPAERLGIFTQPAVIASHSGPTTTRLVKRGVFFTRKVMCLPLGAPPPGVNTMVPETPGATERQKIESITSMSPCNGCHSYINPFGFMQESFDAIGRFRTTDEGKPVDPKISVDFLDEGPVQTSTSVDALRAFTNSARFKQCFARQMFRFYAGRDEIGGDDPLLRQMFFAFASGDQQDIVGMLRTLAGSPSFAQRTEAP
jgi:hypothetical protein